MAATAARSTGLVSATASASSTTGVSRSRWARPATSGTTPPKRAWVSTWLDTTELCTTRPSSTTAAAVSSHEVSMARILTSGLRAWSRRSSCRRPPPRDSQADSVVVGVDAVRPHDEGILVGLGVVVLAEALGLEPEPVVHGLGRQIGHPHLEGQVLGAVQPRRPGQVGQQPGADLVAVPRRVHRDGRHVRLVTAVHQSRVTDDEPVDARRHVVAAGPEVELAHEQGHRPRPRVHLVFDPHHRTKVTPPQRDQMDRYLAPRPPGAG